MDSQHYLKLKNQELKHAFVYLNMKPLTWKLKAWNMKLENQKCKAETNHET